MMNYKWELAVPEGNTNSIMPEYTDKLKKMKFEQISDSGTPKALSIFLILYHALTHMVSDITLLWS